MLTLDDQKLRAVYSQLQLVRLAIGELFHGVHYENFVDTGRYRAIAMPAVMLASEHMLAVANSVNRFC